MLTNNEVSLEETSQFMILALNKKANANLVGLLDVEEWAILRRSWIKKPPASEK